MFFDTSFCVDLLREQAKSEEGPARQKLMQLGNTAKQNGLPIVPRDSIHFAKIPGLVVESYAA